MFARRSCDIKDRENAIYIITDWAEKHTQEGFMNQTHQEREKD